MMNERIRERRQWQSQESELAHGYSDPRDWGRELGRECMIEVLTEHPEMQQAIVQAKRSAQP